MKIGGLAVDPEASGGERVYLLLIRERPGDEELGHTIRNPYALAASEIYEFSTTVVKEKLTGEALLSSEETLKGQGEGKAPLLYPRGMTVDPKTHDLVLVGRQNESTSVTGPEDELEEEEEFERTAVQRIDPSGKLGPRYIDEQNCLLAEPVESEPDCEASDGEWGSAPIVSGGGRVMVQDFGNEIWEIPAAATPEEAYKEVAVVPRHLYSVIPSEEVGAPLLEGEQTYASTGESMSFAASSTSEGRIYLDADYTATDLSESGKALAILDYSEAGGTPSIIEQGWTGGQPSGSKQADCVLPAVAPQIAASSGEGVLALDAQYFEGESVSVLKFGPIVGAIGEACGSEPQLSTPSVTVEGESNLTQVPVGEVAELSSTVSTARATSVQWTFRYREAGGSWKEEAPVHTPTRSRPRRCSNTPSRMSANTKCSRRSPPTTSATRR